MTTTIDRTALQGALGRLASTAGDGRSFPIMACVAFSGTSAATTTMDTFTRVSLPVDVPSVAVDCRQMLAIVRALDGDDVALYADGGSLRITCGRASYKMATQDVTLFPTLPPAPVYAAVDSDGLARVLELAGKLNNDRYGVALEWTDGIVNVAATDGYRLVRRGAVVEPVVLHGSGLRALSGVTFSGAGAAHDWAFFRGDGVEVGIRRSGGSMPDVNSIVTTARANASGVAHINGARLRDALGRVVLMAGETTGRVLLTLADGRMVLKATCPGGDAVDSVPVEGDAKIETAVNGKYMADFIRYAGDTVSLTVNGGRGSALLFTGDGLPDVDYVLMPMAVNV